MAEGHHNFDTGAVLFRQHLSYSLTTSSISTLIPRRARELFDPCVASFIPEVVRRSLKAAASEFVPHETTSDSSLQVLNRLNVESALFTAKPSGTLRGDVPENVPLWLAKSSTALPDTTSSEPETLRDTRREPAGNDFEFNVHAAAFVPFAHPGLLSPATERTNDNFHHASSRFPSVSTVFSDVEGTNSDMAASFDEETSTSSIGEIFDAQSPQIEDQKLIDDHELQFEANPCATDTKQLPLRFLHDHSHEEDYATSMHHLLRSCEAPLSKDPLSMSLVHYVDPASLARASMLEARAPSEDLIYTVILITTRLCIQILQTAFTSHEFALCQIKVLPALPLLVAILVLHKQLIEDFFLGTKMASSTDASPKLQMLIVNSEDMLSETDSDESLLDEKSPLESARISANPDEPGFGPSFRQRTLELHALLKELDTSDVLGNSVGLANEPLVVPTFHHQSYLGNLVSHKSDTDPAISLAVITSPPKGAMSTGSIEDYARQYAVLKQAFLMVDPVIFHGNLNELAELSTPQLRVAAIGKTYKYYVPCGTWLEDKHDIEAPICMDNNATRFLPPVFSEVNDLGNGYYLNDPDSFRNQIELTRHAEITTRKARFDSLKSEQLTHLPRIRSWSPQSSPLIQVQRVSSDAGARILSFDRFLQPSQKSWAELDEDNESDVSSEEEGEQLASGDEEETKEQLNNFQEDSDSSSFWSQVPLLSRTEAIPEDSSFVYSSDEDYDFHSVLPSTASQYTEAARYDRLMQMQPLSLLPSEQFSLDPSNGYDDLSSNEDIVEDRFAQEPDLVANERQAPVSTTKALRSISNPLPEAAEILERAASTRSISYPGGMLDKVSFQLPCRPKPSIPRSEASWNLANIPTQPISSRPKVAVSPLALATIAEDEDEALVSETTDSNLQSKSLSDINKAFRASVGIPEPDLVSDEEFDPATIAFTHKTPASVSKYRRRQSFITVLPPILSSTDDAMEQHTQLQESVSFTPPSSTLYSVDDIEVDTSSDALSVAEFGSSPPVTPTRVMRPMSVTPSRFAGGSTPDDVACLTPPQFADSSILDGISTSPISEESLGFSGVFTTAEAEDHETGDQATEDDVLAQSNSHFYLPPSVIQLPQLQAPSVNTTAATGQVSIADHPEVKKTWKLSKLKDLLSKSKDERSVLKKKGGRKVRGASTASSSTKKSTTKADSLKREGRFGSIRSRMSITIRRK